MFQTDGDLHGDKSCLAILASLRLRARLGPGQTINPHLCSGLPAKGGPKPKAADSHLGWEGGNGDATAWVSSFLCQCSGQGVRAILLN